MERELFHWGVCALGGSLPRRAAPREVLGQTLTPRHEAMPWAYLEIGKGLCFRV